MPQVGFELTFPVFELTNIAHTSNRAATVSDQGDTQQVNLQVKGSWYYLSINTHVS
jgi:hypothetical protein